MGHIKDLHLNILQRVLVCFYYGTMKRHNLQRFKQLLPPAAVCRVWRECMLPYVYYRAYLEYHIKQKDDYNETAQREYEWKSNIDLIVSQRLSSAIRRLRIESFEYPLNFTNMIHALDTIGFSSNHWRAVNALRIFTNHDSVIDDSSSGSSDDEALAAQLTDYFGRHLPNIGDLYIVIHHLPNFSPLLSNKVVNLYISQLHSLICFPTPTTFNCHSFSSNLRCLTVGIASGVTNRLPQLLASPLERLSLFHIPHSFAFWTFIGIAPGHIEFTNLTYLQLDFRQLSENAKESSNPNRQVNTSTASLNIGYRKLFFPKLKELIIVYSPYNDGALYSMFVHSPLQYVKIYSSFKSVQHMDPRIMFNAVEVHLRIHSVSHDDDNDYVAFYCKLLGTPSNAKVAKLSVYQSSVPLPIPDIIEWVNIENLTIRANIHLASVIQVITQLPKLHTLKVYNPVDEVDEAGANLQAILEGNLIQTQFITPSLESISIYSDSRVPLVFSLDVMCYLTVLIQSLDKVIVPDLYVSDIKEFAVRYADSFPHLHGVNVLGASEERGW